MLKGARCASCKAPIYWIEMRGGKKMPVDYPGESRVWFGCVVKVYTSHFATCPNADKHRKRDQ